MSDTLHTFQPTVTVTRNPDGSYAAEFDWSDAYIGGLDLDADEHEHDPRHPEGEAACAAVAAWQGDGRPDVAVIPGGPITVHKVYDPSMGIPDETLSGPRSIVEAKILADLAWAEGLVGLDGDRVTLNTDTTGTPTAWFLTLHMGDGTTQTDVFRVVADPAA